ncbi:MAG: hypothetical protein HW421_2626 [Ignavibacteria bacterium]|nr:hypothetical protein [Ignavibacteria bacterium]
MKSASDFMISLGLSDNVMALDSRIVGFLTNYLGFNVKVGKIQSNQELYRIIEDSLRKECEKMNIKLAILDRIIFQYSSKSAIDFILESKFRK